MPRRALILPALWFAAAGLAADPPRQREGTLKVGDPAPALAADLLGQSKSIKLADLRGKPTVLIFGSCT
ncbi:MAG TPA: hypothetical protein VGF55_08455 [Gemmataceae bacterium]|jgi:hypothetical protein